MVTTSSDRGLQIPTVAGDSGVWGNELNATIGALDSILGGTLTLQSSNGLSATLSSSQAQMARIVVGGALATNYTLTFPSSNFAQGSYVIWNNSSAPGNNGVLCQTTGGGSTCLVPGNSVRFIYADGINCMFADQQASATSLPSYSNKFRNPGMDVCQRSPFAGPASVGASGSYTIDGWRISYSGGTPTYAQINAGNIKNSSSVRISGPGTAMTGLTISQRIESLIAEQLLGKTGTQPITVQFTVYNGTGSSFTPTLSTSYPTASDNYTSTTSDLAPVNLQACPNATVTTVAYTFTPSANLFNGYEIALNLGSALNNNSNFIDVSLADVRATPGVSAGLNSSPAIAEVRPATMELQYCYRYLFVPQSGWGYMQLSNGLGGATGLTGVITVGFWFPFPAMMFKVPTLSNWTHNAGIGVIIGSPANATISGVGWGWNLQAAVGTSGAAWTTGGQFIAEI